MNDETVEELLRRHTASDNRNVVAVREAVSRREFKIRRPEGGVPCRELLGIYTRRERHLAGFRSPHAKAVLADVSQLCKGLRAAVDGECWVWDFELPDGISVAFFEEKMTGQLLGTVRTVDRTRVSETQWRELWGSDYPDAV